ncbi:acyl-ACP--UDP-N-acetylglucosamine O-acyltransferase [Pseudogulbenkiania subflava]|uniref:Acyl-[acyl-carrier-protein]--UDP-N-acetylglucosamine O-acyltransferase n=1 Tax=Pseudogulbenkiania subflava DSM 22618 TaxID=1123014 RepID=A0A1Y6C6E0_9NEIS|nr:acyl-ACP--UDP-N-acetylglucosamine O-acyltransferase [Pseudogulbenkiania subflava]SMF44357.1 acyl-[acyl-carrier-protein]--UDP-N-acetylglucosamine O-acyltransferase [Pseudogulbenkiania subflava DSM 22618]
MAIHPTAIVDPNARVAPDVEIGAYSIVGPNVSIDSGTWVGPHVVIEGHTSIGKNNRIFQFCSLGAIPQDKKYAGEPTRLEIGDNNTIREFCTFNVGTAQDVGVTRLGNNNWIMAYVHLGHDCQVGSNTIFANNATLGGHVHIGDWVILGGFTSVHQFGIIGEHAMTAFASAVAQDVPPYVMAHGNRAVPSGINAEGLKRRGFTPEQIRSIRQAYKTLYRNGLSLDEAKQAIIAEAASHPELEAFVRFFGLSERGIIR